MTENSLVSNFAMRCRHLAAPVLRQLSLLFPDWLVSPNLGLSKVRIVQIEPAALSDVRQIKVKQNAVVDVVLTRECCLEKTIIVPPAATAHVSAVVDVFLRQSLPGSGQGMEWRTGRVKQVGGSGSIVAYVLKRSVLERIGAHIENQGGRLRQIRMQGDLHIAPFVDHRAKVNQPARIWLGIAGVAYIAVCGVLVAQSYQAAVRSEDQVATLQMQRSALADQAAALVSAAQSQDATAGSQQQDLAAILAKSGRSKILENLTALVPDDIWLSEFSLSADELRVSGRTQSDVVGLVSTLQGADWVKRAKLDGPVMQIGFDEGNGFEMLIDIDSQKLWGLE